MPGQVSAMPTKGDALPPKSSDKAASGSVEIVDDDKKKAEEVVSWISLYQGADGLDVVALIIGVIGAVQHTRRIIWVFRHLRTMLSAWVDTQYLVLHIWSCAGAAANGVVFPLFALVFGEVRTYKPHVSTELSFHSDVSRFCRVWMIIRDVPGGNAFRTNSYIRRDCKYLMQAFCRTNPLFSWRDSQTVWLLVLLFLRLSSKSRAP